MWTAQNMFGFFKNKPAPINPYADKRWFIDEVFGKIRKITDPNKKLEKYAYLCEIIFTLEREFGTECLEIDFERDSIRDAFNEATDPGTLLICALAYGSPLKNQIEAVTNAYISRLPDHLKARLIRTYIISELDQEMVDPKEFDPDLQHAFYEVEQRKLSEFEKARVLETEFGVTGWRDREKMNPHVMYTPLRPPASD